MSTGPGSGDRLARGAARASFTTTEGGIAEDKWAKAFDDFDPEKFKNAPDQSRVRNSDSDSEEAGTTGTDVGETFPSDRPEIDGFGN